MTGRVRLRPDIGQSTVEVALAVPIVVVILLVVLQVAVVVRDAVALTAAARAGARRAMVVPNQSAVLAAASGETRLRRDRLRATVSGDPGPDGFVTVVVSYRSPTDVPLVGAFIGDVDLSERLVVLRE